MSAAKKSHYPSIQRFLVANKGNCSISSQQKIYVINASESQNLWESFRDKLEGHSPWDILQMAEDCASTSTTMRHNTLHLHCSDSCDSMQCAPLRLSQQLFSRGDYTQFSFYSMSHPRARLYGVVDLSPESLHLAVEDGDTERKFWVLRGN